MTGRGLVDTFHRKINYLRISITDRCNLRCLYCMPEEGVPLLSHESILSFEEILRVARVAISMGITKVRITGGEPLVRKGLTSLIEELAGLNGLRDISLTTNGVLLDKMSEELKRAGLKRLNISLDTLKADVYRKITRCGEIDRVLAGIDKAKEVGFSPLKVNMVPMKGVNDGEILDFVAFAQEKDVEVRFIEFMPSREDEWRREAIIESGDIIKTISSAYDLTPLAAGEDAGPCKLFSIKGGGRCGVISPMSEHFCGTCNRLRLTADGKLRGCLFSEKETDLRALLRDEGCTDEAIAEVLRGAVHAKPEGHKYEESGGGSKGGGFKMSRVGG